jgi:hypothetical protein
MRILKTKRIIFFKIYSGVKYVITVKTGAQSLEKYNGNLGINIVSRNFDTGFIKLDTNIVAEPKTIDKNQNRMDPVKIKKTKKTSLFNRNQKDVFEFEDQDIRTVIHILYNFLN